VNLGNLKEYAIMEIAQKILALTGSPSKLIYLPLPPDDPGRRRPDITRARDRLGWQPQIPLETGLKETIPYFAAKLREKNEAAARPLSQGGVKQAKRKAKQSG